MTYDLSVKPVYENFEKHGSQEFRRLVLMDRIIEEVMNITDELFTLKEIMTDRVKSGDVKSLQEMDDRFVIPFSDLLDAFDERISSLISDTAEQEPFLVGEGNE